MCCREKTQQRKHTSWVFPGRPQKGKVSVKSPHFTSVARIVIRRTILRPMVPSFYLSPPPVSISASFYRFTGTWSYLKQYGKERSQNKDLRSHLGIKLGTSCTEGRALINCANPSSLKGKQHIYPVQLSNFQRVGSAQRVTYLAGSPFGDDRVSLLDGPTILHINTLARPAGEIGQCETIRACTSSAGSGKKGQLFSHINVYYSWLGLEDDPSTLDRFSPYKQGLNLLLLLDLATKGFSPDSPVILSLRIQTNSSSILSSQPLVNEYLF